MYRFAPASPDEHAVFGASRPGYSAGEVQDWLRFMRQSGIDRICCLLSESQLARYIDLLGAYRHEFGEERVCWAPVDYFHFADAEMLTKTILPFLAEAEAHAEKVVVHCSGGVGRTGHVLAAWLVAVRGMSNRAAIAAVRASGRNPDEAAIAAVARGGNPLKATGELDRLLDGCRLAARDRTGFE